MSATNFTPISLYYSATAASVPTAGNLVAGELALNTADGKLFYKDSSGVVQVLATKGGVGSSTTTQVLYNSSGLVVGSAGLTFDGTNLATTGTATATRFIPSGSTVATNGMFLPAANTLGFSTASTETMRIDSSGNVIAGGTSTYGARLGVIGTASGSNNYIQITNPGIGTGTIGLTASSGNFKLYNSYASGTLTSGSGIDIDTSGNVMVGTTSPIGSSKFNVQTSGGAVPAMTLYSPSTTNGAQIVFSDNLYSAYITGLPAGGATGLGFGASGAERMRIDSSGNVGIGTSSPATTLEVASSTTNTNIRVTNTLSFFEFQSNNNDGYVNLSGSGSVIFRSGTPSVSERMRIDSSGNLLVACTGLPTGGVGGISLSSPATSNGMLLGTTGTGATNMIRFYNPNGNVGAITTSGSLTTYAVSSDYRLKENLASLENSKEFILSLKPKQGNWKADGSKFVGFVAHEFAQTSPTSVIGEKDAVDAEGKPVYQSMQASSAEVMANLVALVQEQQALIESLTIRLTALESK